MAGKKSKNSGKRSDEKSDKDAKSSKSSKSAKSEKNEKSEKSDRLSKSDYLERLQPMQVELNNLGRWLQHTRKRLLVIVEGRDTAGKGGVISAISETLSPRQCRTVALGKPSEREQGEWYFQRYLTHLPSAGEIVLFDRSWYNRAGVEAVMGFCTPQQTEDFLKQAPTLERLLVDDGLLLFKYWLTVDQEQQEERFAERAEDPLKQWKLSPIDLEARQHYEDYGRARDRMLEHTHTRHAPWALVDFNDQRRGRLTLIRHLLDHLPDVSVPAKELQFPPVAGGLKEERFGGKLKPIKSL
ncbi:MAG: polyphosphate kinase 2 [Rubrivivax sp.]|nr:MAG: polyphosphate kinase 2 [Rubrivivax sp.]